MVPRALAACLIFALAGCSAPSPDDPGSADPPRGAAAPVDLDALAAQRAASSGAALEDEAAQARAQSATRAYANRPGEPTLEDQEAAAPRAPGEVGHDVFRGANAGSGVPSDLERAEGDAPIVNEPWINMLAVEQAILAQSKAMKACWDTEGPGGSGRVDMRVTVGGGGRVVSVGVAPGSPHQGAASDCLARTLRAIRYPEPRGGDATFVYPVKF